VQQQLVADDSFYGSAGTQQRAAETREEGGGAPRGADPRPEEEVGWWRRSEGEEIDHEGKTREDPEEASRRLRLHT
jgi:hypothetical protein